MKTFREWLEEKGISEGIFDSRGAKAWAGAMLGKTIGVGPIIGAQIGWAMGDKKKPSPAPSVGPDFISKALSRWADSSRESRIKKLVSQGVSEEDAEKYVASEENDRFFKTKQEPDYRGDPRYAYYRDKYPNVFK